MAQSLSFIRVATLPTTGLVTGRIYFVEDTHSLYVATSATEAVCYSGLLNAVLADNVLTITKADKTTCVVNLQDVASASKMEEELAKKLNIGTAGDASTVISYYGVKKYADEQVAAAKAGAEATAKSYTDEQIGTVNTMISGIDGRVTQNTTDITNLTNTVGNNATTAKNYTDEQVGLAKTYAEEKAAAAESAAKAHAEEKASAAETAANSYADGVAATAKQEAIEAAATDATTKANAAEANAKQFATEQIAAQIATAFTYEGSVATYAELPTENLAKGMVYNVEAANGNTPAGTNYVWNGEAWDALAGVVDLTPFLKSADAASTYETIENVSTYKETVAATYETIANVNNFKTEVSNTYATKDALSQHEQTANSTFATQTALGETNTKVSQLETAVEEINTDLADYAKTTEVTEAINSAKTELQGKIDLKADITTVTGIEGRLATAEGTVATHTQGIADNAAAIKAISDSYVKSITSGTSGTYVAVTSNTKATGEVNVIVDSSALDTEIATMKQSITASMSWVEF